MKTQSTEMELSPAQQQALENLLRSLRTSPVAMLLGEAGLGKTTVLRHAHQVLGGAFLTMKEVMDAMEGKHPLSMEETFYRLLWQALSNHDVVLLDDLHLVSNVVVGNHFYPRQGFLGAALAALGAYAKQAGKRLVFGTEPNMLAAMWTGGSRSRITEFGTEDYERVCRWYLGADGAGRVDWHKVHRFARKLNARQLASTCEALRDSGKIDTDNFIDHLRAHHLVSNVDLGEVQAVDLRDLKGLEEVIETLEANLILPLESAELAAEFGLKPKRGVLLAGPPGTGKTTIGRALAHRLRSKFFLIDGTVISGTAGFYQRVQQIFEAAKQNAPGIIFIDDSDVIFEAGEETGLYRYLLTMLDGLESESAGGVCLMMTAMNVGNLPPALVRSGRIELWLETRLPDEAARTAILTERCIELPASMGEVDIPRLASATEGLSGADLKRLVEDGKILFAYDRYLGRPPRPVEEYFLAAVETVRANKQRYAEAEARAREHRPARPPYFDMIPSLGHHEIGFAVGEP